MSAGFEMDPDAVLNSIGAAVASFDFSIPGEAGQTLGRDLAVAVALGIADRSADGKDPDGNDWRPNSDTPFHGLPGYATYKRQRYDVDRPGELGGQMLSQLSLLGQTTVTADEVEMVYGVNTPPQRTTARNGKPLKPRELVPTDRQKADWFTQGGRRFYEPDSDVVKAVIAVAEEALARHLEQINGG